MKLGRFWTDPWPWDESMGVGLRLTGYPRNEQEFLGFLHEESCNPVAALRILNDLKKHGEKLTTVQPSFNFARLGDEFGRLGVKMEVIAPIEKPNNTMIDAAALQLCLKGQSTILPSLSEEEQEEARKRALDTGSIAVETLGPYAHMAQSI